MKQLEGRVAAVTASTRGIGRACAEALAAEGALVYLAARSAERAAPAIEAIERAGGAARFVRYDAADEQSPAAMLEQITREAGRLDLLVNNFGYTDVERDRDVASGDPQVFFEILRRNIASVYLPVRAALPLLRVRGGSIVNISSVGGVLPDLSRLAYCVSKASINSLTQNLAVQLARDGIRCNAVLPGLTATDAAAQNLSEE
ncbi:MAG: SDR family oxidoreductase, partial [Oscillospiraceae bacterium]